MLIAGGIMDKKHYLTKSRFIKALECPTKMYYSANKDYASTQANEFYLALQEGGYIKIKQDR